MTSGGTPVFPRDRDRGLRADWRLPGAGARARWPGSLVIAHRSPERRSRTAMRLEAITDGGERPRDWRRTPDLVVLAAPVRQNLDLLRQLGGHVAGDALVTDVGSTKAPPSTAARRAARRACASSAATRSPAPRSAASRRRAPTCSTADRGCWPPTATRQTRTSSGSRHSSTGVGATPRRIDAAEHDRLLAVPQPSAADRRQRADARRRASRSGEDGLALAGRGLRDTTRLAAEPAGHLAGRRRHQSRPRSARRSTI